MTKRLKNTTGSDIFDSTSGYNFPAGIYVEIDELDVYRLNTSSIKTYMDDGDLVFNDGTSDYADADEGFARLTNGAFGTAFLDNSIRANDFDSDNVQEAIEEAREYTELFPRIAKSVSANGVVGNNDWLGPNELLPNTPMMTMPLKLQLNEIAWSNQKTDVEFHIEFRNGSKTGTIFYTLTVTAPNSGYGYVSGLSFNFNPGDTIWAQYKDDGQNMSDAEIVLWMSRMP